jgi:hypothetical protein
MVIRPLAVFSCFSWPDHHLEGGVNANSIRACDYYNQTSSLTIQEFTCVIFSIQAYGQCGTGADFLQVIRFLLPIFILPNGSILIYHPELVE